MAEQNFPDNTLYELDNLDVLRGMNSETVDLIATDPPFNTKRNRAGTAGFYVDNWKWGDTGKLPDQWAWNEVHPVWLEQIKDDNPALYEVIEAARVCHGEDIAAFLCFLSVRLMECRRVLKPTGSIYLHCDHAANAYIRMAMDAIFGAKNFRNEIVWCYKGMSPGKIRFTQQHDTIFFYGKTEKSTFNVLRTAPDEGSLKTYASSERIGYNANHNRMLVTIWNWDKYRQAVESGKIPAGMREVEFTGGRPPMRDWWADIKMLGGPTNKERTGSPDQKPLALYERIILASSNPGDIVLDPFAGCATTIMAARNHGRRWVGIDRRTDARYHVVCRMAGIKANDADKMRKRPDLADWLDGQLAKYDAHYSTNAPERTDTGEHAAPELEPVFYPIRHEQPPWQRLTHAEMRGILNRTQSLNRQGEWVICAGCGRELEWPFMELDHISPKMAAARTTSPTASCFAGRATGRSAATSPCPDCTA